MPDRLNGQIVFRESGRLKASIINHMKKYASVFASFFIMSALGGLYAWSIFVEPLKNEVGVSTGFTQLIFGIIIGILPVAMVLGGRMVSARGPKITAFVSALMFGGGYISAGIFKNNPVFLLIGIGLFSGIGTGLGYIAALSTPVKWFPERRGLITGISTSGFGAGAIFLSLFVKGFLKAQFPVFRMFLYIGVVYGVVIMVSSLLLFEPGTFREKRSGRIKERWSLDFFGERIFWGLFLGMFSGSFAGLLIIGNLKPLALYIGIKEVTALISISVLSVGNTLGRILWGHIADLFGMLKSIKTSLLLLSLSVLLLFFLSTSGLFTFMALVVGISFGANFVLYAASVARFFGTERIGEIYPFISFSYGLAGILGPPIGGFTFDLTGSYLWPILIASIVALTGCIISGFLLSK